MPGLPGLPLIGNLLEVHAAIDSRCRTRPRHSARSRGVQLAHIPIYVVTDADIAHEVLVDQAGAVQEVAPACSS